MNPYDYQQQQQRLMAAAYMNSMGAAPMGSYNPMANMNGMGMAPAPMPGMNMSMNNMTGMLTPGQIYHQAAAPAPVMSAPAAVMMQQPQPQQQQQQLPPQQITRPVVCAQPLEKPKVHSARPRSPKHDLTARLDDDGKKSGPWSWKEHQLFERAVIVHGWGNWVQVSLIRRLQTLFLTSSANNFYVHTIPMYIHLVYTLHTFK